MLLVDFQQVMLSTLHAQLGQHTNAKLDPPMLKHMILNTLRSIIMRFKSQNEDKLIVIACDNRHSWRRDFFPYYKAARKKTRDASDLDWKAIFEVFDQVKADMRENFPYVVIDLEGAEADDVIGTLVRYYPGRSIIVSGDMDFIQLHTIHSNKVIQYDNIRKRFLSTTNQNYLLEHVLEGDRGDGVPNVLSDGDSFVVGKRQTPLRAKTTERMIKELHDLPNNMVDWDPKITSNYLRNRQLIDLQFTPQEIKDEIIKQFEQQKGTRKTNVMMYLMANKMSDLLEKVQEFH